MTDFASKIRDRALKSLGSLESTNHQALVLAEKVMTPAPPKAKDWARFANELAFAEGNAHAWNQLARVFDYFERENAELTPAVILDTIAEILSAGADDGWSGRTNDNQRARFDGVRAACTNARDIVTD